MKVKISFWFRESGAGKPWKNSFEEDMPCTGDDKQDYRNALAYLVNKIITGEIELGNEGTIQEIGIRGISWYGPEAEVETPVENIPALEKITKELSVLIERKIIDLGPGIRFWAKTRYDDYRLCILREDRSATILHTHEVFFPDPEKIVLTEKIKDFSFTIKPPERAKPIKMATKKATPAPATATIPAKGKGKAVPAAPAAPVKPSKADKQKNLAVVPADDKKKKADPAVEKAPTKKSIVAGHLKAGLKPAEIVEIMGKNGVTTTLASVRAFIASINAGE